MPNFNTVSYDVNFNAVILGMAATARFSPGAEEGGGSVLEPRRPNFGRFLRQNRSKSKSRTWSKNEGVFGLKSAGKCNRAIVIFAIFGPKVHLKRCAFGPKTTHG